MIHYNDALAQPLLQRQRTGTEPIVIPDHIIDVSNISKCFLEKLFENAKNMRHLVKTKGGDDRLKHRVLGLLFYEPSTRTSCSFQAAMQRLGGTVICVNEKDSSAQKGETIEDTVQTLSCYCDVIVIRNPMKGSAALAASVATKPVINAGDGTGEHPTQALLDTFTIQSELGIIGSLNPSCPMIITVIGDLKHGRTAHSLVKLLSLFHGIMIQYVSPESLDGLEEFSHVWITFKFHLNTNTLKESKAFDGVLSTKKRFTFTAKITPPMLKEKKGVLATRSPHRPNPVGVTLATIESIDKKSRSIFLSACDLVEGTPVLDIKPYVPSYDTVQEYKVPVWISETIDTRNTVIIKAEAIEQANKIQNKFKHYKNNVVLYLNGLKETLEVDVRSSFQTK
jgi:aspartate carbamoyltransferase